MNHNHYEICRDALLNYAAGIEDAKRPAYTANSADVLHNFKSVAGRLGITPMQVWGVYFLKHIDALVSAAKDPTIPQAEELVGRFADAINYLKLGYALLEEQKTPGPGSWIEARELDGPRTDSF